MQGRSKLINKPSFSSTFSAPMSEYSGEIEHKKKLWDCSKSFGEGQFKSEELQNWLISNLLGCVVACTSHELTEQLHLIIYVALLIKCLSGTEYLWLHFRQRRIGVIEEKILLSVFFGRPSPHFYVPGRRREESTFWGSDYKPMIFQQ